MAQVVRIELFSFFIGFRLEFLVLDHEALVAASADLSFFIISSDLKYELASVDFH